MRNRNLLILLISLLYLATVSSLVQGATISNCSFDNNVYNQGETGYVTVTIDNDEEDKIRVIELTAHVDYYYTDGNTYLQTFFTDETLPKEILQGQSETLQIPFSLPTNIAPGYTEVYVRAKTELWNNRSESWFEADHSTYWLTLNLESPYKELFESQTEVNNQLQTELQELEAVNATTTNLMYLLGATTMVFIAVTAFLLMLSRRAIARPAN